MVSWTLLLPVDVPRMRVAPLSQNRDFSVLLSRHPVPQPLGSSSCFSMLTMVFLQNITIAITAGYLSVPVSHLSPAGWRSYC